MNITVVGVEIEAALRLLHGLDNLILTGLSFCASRASAGPAAKLIGSESLLSDCLDTPRRAHVEVTSGCANSPRR